MTVEIDESMFGKRKVGHLGKIFEINRKYFSIIEALLWAVVKCGFLVVFVERREYYLLMLFLTSTFY